MSSPGAPAAPSCASRAWHNQVSKPVIAAVNGTCAGGGLHFVADADIVIASSDATFLDPHVSVGQVTAYEAIGLMRKSPMEPICAWRLTGRHERMTRRRAYELGICREVVDPHRAAARRGAGPGREDRAATRRRRWPRPSERCGAREMGLTDACRAGVEELIGMWGHPDQLEGPAAFAAKRPPAMGPSQRRSTERAIP